MTTIKELHTRLLDVAAQWDDWTTRHPGSPVPDNIARRYAETRATLLATRADTTEELLCKARVCLGIEGGDYSPPDDETRGILEDVLRLVSERQDTPPPDMATLPDWPSRVAITLLRRYPEKPGLVVDVLTALGEADPLLAPAIHQAGGARKIVGAASSILAGDPAGEGER